ncbi:hypothetical protein F0521_08270 [Ferrimonas sp. YFM]|nr:hypothetical protein F0521_08270 [Ferrimonas sp. YFM]
MQGDFPLRAAPLSGIHCLACFTRYPDSMARPNSKLPDRSVQISCSRCRTQLLRYRKGGNGALVKCFMERITEDHTQEPGICPGCGSQFGRQTLIRGVPALKMVGGKVRVK